MIEDRLTAADESVAQRFTRQMNATTSALGLLTDPPLVGLATAFGVLALLLGLERDVAPGALLALKALATLPILVAVVVGLWLRRARGEVVAWLAGLPFPLENLNALLCGVGDEVVVCFADAMPSLAELNAALDEVHPEAFTTELRSDTREAQIKIGVLHSKHNPAASNHRRYERLRAIVDQVLVPLSSERPIARAYLA